MIDPIEKTEEQPERDGHEVVDPETGWNEHQQIDEEGNELDPEDIK